MTDIRIFAHGVGEIVFDGESAVLSGIDWGYPQIHRPSLVKNTLYGAQFLTPTLGAAKITLKGYFLSRSVSAGESHRLLCAIVGAGGEFTLCAGERTRKVSCESLSFCSDPGFCSGMAEKFTLVLTSATPFFEGNARTVCGVPDASGAIVFPTSLVDSTGTLSSHGTVTVDNRGDAVCGFVLKVSFPASASSFILTSDREDGIFAIARPISSGEVITLDTRTGRKGVTDADGDSVLGDVDVSCRFHSVYPGQNIFRWKCTSAKAPHVELTFTEGYLTGEVGA